MKRLGPCHVPEIVARVLARRYRRLIKMIASILALAGVASAFSFTTYAVNSTNSNSTLLTDITQISKYWGQITPYSDNTEDYFGVKYTGLPSGCQVEQAHVLQRHAQRFPTSGADDGKKVHTGRSDNDLRLQVATTNASLPRWPTSPWQTQAASSQDPWPS